MARNHKDFIQAYMEYASYSEAPEMFHFWTAVSILAGATRRKTWIELGYFQWVANFYIIFVAPPGVVQKSTTSAIGMDILREVPNVIFGPEAITWQALTQCMAKAKQTIADKHTSTHSVMSAITICSSELGTLLDPSDREMIDALVTLWDGRKGVWEKVTKTQGNDSIENPWLNIIGCTTPAWLEGNFPDYLIGGGFTSRTIFVYGDTKRQLVAYPHTVMPKGHLDKRKALLEDLKEVASLCGEMTITPDAIKWGEAWYIDFHTNRPKHLNQPFFAGYIQRKQMHIHKLAMILSLAQGEELLIEQKHLECANAIVTALEHDMPKVFNKIGQTDFGRKQGDLVDTIHNVGRITTSALYRQVMRKFSQFEFEQAIKGIVKSGQAVLLQKGQDQFIIWKG